MVRKNVSPNGFLRKYKCVNKRMGGRKMSIYNGKCRLNGYEDTRDWYLAWETYKYLYRNEELIQEQKYKDILAVAEDIVVWHMCGNDPKSKYDDVLEFYRFYVTLAKNEDEHNFVLTDEVAKYLAFIKKECEKRIVRRVLAFAFEDDSTVRS